MHRPTRRQLLRGASAVALGLTGIQTFGTPPPAQACSSDDDGLSRWTACGQVFDRPDGGVAGFERWWVQVFSPTQLWPSPRETREPLGPAEFGQYFRVETPQNGPRLRVWDPRENRIAYVRAESVGPVGPPDWAQYLNGADGRWIDVDLTVPQHSRAMQGDLAVHKGLVTAGLQGTTRPGRYTILRRVYNETMDSRTIPGLTDSYYLKNVLFTQYFTSDGAAIHYNWWGPPFGFGRPGSHGCLGMMYDDSKFYWDWADLGVPVIIHA